MLSIERNKKEMYKEITNFLSNRRLKEALTQIKAFAEKLHDWKNLSIIETLETNYTYLLKYAYQGQNDPQRNNLYLDIQNKLYELADELRIRDKFNNGKGYMANLYRTYQRNPGPSFLELQSQLTKLNETEGIKVTEENGSNHELFQPHFNFTDQLFKKTLFTLHWSHSEYLEAYQLVGCGMSTFDLEVWISGITIALLNCYDVEKFNFLLNIYLNKSISSVKARALVGIALAAYYYGNQIEKDDKASILLNFMINKNQEVRQQLIIIQRLLIISRETEKIDKKMRKEIIPQMMKNPYLKHPNKKMDEIELWELDEDNPEWEKDLDKMHEQIHELGELQREGADTYMSTFAMLKNYPFFHEIAHWFYPFTIEYPTIAKILPIKEIKENTILHALLNSTAFCNSDKYSFALTLNEIPFQQMEMMKESSEGTEEILNDQLGAQSIYTDEEKLQVMYRQYLHDLYRFFKLWQSRNELNDIFKDSLNLWNGPLHDSLMNGEQAIQLANYLLSKGYYKEANDFYSYLLEKNPIDTELIQKVGFCLQKQREFKRALRFYNQAYILKPQDTWTLKHMAHCYKKLHDEEKALQFFQLASDMNPDDLNLAMQVGQCLTLMEDYEKALTYFFKVEYLGNTPDYAHRAIAWCYFMTNKHEESIRFYQKVLKETSPTINDWINIGHVYLVQGLLESAVKNYKEAASLCKTHDEFIEIFSHDTEHLLQKGVDPITIGIVLDLV